MVYCKKATEEHPISIKFPQSLIGINTMITKEGQRCNMFENNLRVLDMDDVETNLARQQKRSKNKTTDFAMGIKINKSTKFLLAEGRFRYGKEGAKKLTKGELMPKVNGSIGILDQEPPIHTDIYFLFSKDAIKEARSNMVRLSTGRYKYYAMTIEEFKDCFILPCSNDCKDNVCIYFQVAK